MTLPCSSQVPPQLGALSLSPVLTAVPKITTGTVTSVAVGGSWEVAAGSLVLTGVQETGIHTTWAVVTCRWVQKVRDTGHRAERKWAPSFPFSISSMSPCFLPGSAFLYFRAHLAGRCRRKSARDLGSQHGLDRVQMHRSWSPCSQAPHSPGGLGLAGVVIQMEWCQARPPIETTNQELRPMPGPGARPP